MEFVFFWIGFSIAVGAAASSRGRTGIGWFLLALIFSPILMLVLVLVIPRKNGASVTIVEGPPHVPLVGKSRYFDPRTGARTPPPTHKTCPACAEAVRIDARICRFCRHDFAEIAAE